MKKLEITKGDWIISSIDNTKVWNSFKSRASTCVALSTNEAQNRDFYTDKSYEEMKNNAILIADAGTTYSKLPILPSQLAEDRERLIECLNRLCKVVKKDMDLHGNNSLSEYYEAQELLNSLNQ